MTSLRRRQRESVGRRQAAMACRPMGCSTSIGSVQQWVKDWYADDFYQASPARDPQGPLRGSFRVLRGGNGMKNHRIFRPAIEGGMK